jgi:hypothetical protein
VIVHFVYYPFPSARVASADTAPEHPLPSFPSLLPPEPRGACRETRARSQDDGAGGGGCFPASCVLYRVEEKRDATQGGPGSRSDVPKVGSSPPLDGCTTGRGAGAGRGGGIPTSATLAKGGAACGHSTSSPPEGGAAADSIFCDAALWWRASMAVMAVVGVSGSGVCLSPQRSFVSIATPMVGRRGGRVRWRLATHMVTPVGTTKEWSFGSVA